MTDRHTWDQRHRLLEIANDADQAERQAMLLGNTPIEAGIADEAIAGVIDDADIAEGQALQGWAQGDAHVEDFAGDLAGELARRANLLGASYPFVIEGSRLGYRGSRTGVYEFCLAVCLADSLTRGEYRKLPVQFELLCTELLRRLISPQAKSVRTGWPSHDLTLRPPRFKAMCKLLAEASNEWIWSPQDPNPDNPTTAQVKDEGVDFVVWVPFGDGRGGQLFVLCQCACGADWDEKMAELTNARLDRWLRPVTFAPFQRAFAVPRHIPGSFVFTHVAAQAGIPLDRVRLTLIAESPTHSEEVAAQFKPTLDGLIRHVFPALPVVAAA